MIEQALNEHLRTNTGLAAFFATYNGEPAIFNQEAPADKDPLWGEGSQYGRIVFYVDIQGDPERTMGGTLSVDIMCKEDQQFPEEVEPVVRDLIHGYFFSSGTFTVAAQWRDSSYFTNPTDQVTGCTISFSLLGFPIMTTADPDVVQNLNEYLSLLDGVHVINHDILPESAWRPTENESAIYCRVVNDNQAGWIPDTFQTIWRTSIVKCHIFSQNISIASTLSRNIVHNLYRIKRLIKPGSSPIMVNRNNSIDIGADPLRTGQITIEATYGVIVYDSNDKTIEHIHY